jgi:hypothetical protein
LIDRAIKPRRTGKCQLFPSALPRDNCWILALNERSTGGGRAGTRLARRMERGFVAPQGFRTDQSAEDEPIRMEEVDA